MNPLLIKIARFVAKRPQDRTIRLVHIIAGLFIMALLWYADNQSVLDIPFMGALSDFQEQNIHLGFMGLGLLLVLKGLIPFCLIKHKTLRISQATIGLLLIIIGGPIMDPIVREIPGFQPKDTQSFSIAVGPAVQKSHHPGTILILFGLLWIFIGITGKGTTEKCLRYKEVIKKIRV